MQLIHNDPRLAAAHLTVEEFIGHVENDDSDISMSDLLIEHYQDKSFWAGCPELPLLDPLPGYSLRCCVPADDHAAYLIYEDAVVGVFVETDSLVVRSDHQGKRLGRELILAAFAQKPWRSPNRKASSAGKKSLADAHNLAIQAQQSLQADSHA